MKRKKNKFQREEIIWNIVNCMIAGTLVFLGSVTSGSITFSSIILSVSASLIVALVKFSEYWKTQEGEYTTKVFNFI